jgi:hypothetical protein
MEKRLNKTKVTIILSGALILMSLVQARPVVACCDNFWSCAAAIATGGMSCAIEDFIKTVNTIITSVQNLQTTINKDVGAVIAASRQAVATAGSNLKNLVQTAKNDADAALASAQQTSNSFQAQASAANTSTIDAKLKETLPRATAEIANLKPPLTTMANTVQQAADIAKTQVESQVQASTDLEVKPSALGEATAFQPMQDCT